MKFEEEVDKIFSKVKEQLSLKLVGMRVHDFTPDAQWKNLRIIFRGLLLKCR